MLTITTASERIDPSIRMHRSLARYNAPVYQFKRCLGRTSSPLWSDLGFSVRTRGNPRPLEFEDLLPLPGHLDPHPFDFSPEMVEVWHGVARRVEGRIRTKNRTKRQAARFGGAGNE